MDKEQRAALRKLAEEATPGPWMRLFGERTVYDRMEDGCRGNAIVRADLGYSIQDTLNIDYIAAANPSTILQLLDYIETLEKDAARYRWLRDVENSLTEDDPCVSNSFFNSWYGEDLDKVIDELIERNAAMQGETE